MSASETTAGTHARPRARTLGLHARPARARSGVGAMSLSSEPKGCWTTVERPPRRVYIDAGANWANTLRLYRDELHKLSRFPVKRSTSSQPWEIYAFEASPVIQPFVEDFVKHLNGLAPHWSRYELHNRTSIHSKKLIITISPPPI